jgi:hypothetical protein
MIDELLKRSKQCGRGRIRMRDPSSFDPDFCPYYDIRIFLRTAVRLARDQQQTALDADRQVDELKQMEKDAEAIIERLKRFSRNNSTSPLILLHELGDINDLSPMREDIAALAAQHRNIKAKFDLLVDAAKGFRKELHCQAAAIERKLRPPHSRGNVWGQAFVDCMARYFFFLTGSMPRPDNLFLKFANAAYKSVAGNGSLKAQVRTVLERRKKMPAWAQFDREGTSRPILSQFTPTPNSVVPGTPEWRERWELAARLAARGHAGAAAALRTAIGIYGKPLESLLAEKSLALPA